MSKTVLGSGVVVVTCAVVGLFLILSSPAVSKDERQRAGNPQGLSVYTLGF
jgi:flagellar basal body-associated protein FliL